MGGGDLPDTPALEVIGAGPPEFFLQRALVDLTAPKEAPSSRTEPSAAENIDAFAYDGRDASRTISGVGLPLPARHGRS
ncbi:MAG: hypothetical protein ACREOS_11385 [Candidatus Dormibacteraceae bacterium]